MGNEWYAWKMETVMANEGARLDKTLRAAGIAIVGVSIGHIDDKTTWKVQPPQLQAQAQPIIYAFDANDPAHAAAELSLLAQSTSQEKSNLAMLACIVRSRNVNEWNVMTTTQKITAVRNEANVFKGIREFIDNKL